MEDKVNEIMVSYRERTAVWESEPLCDSGKVARLLYGTWDKDTIGYQESFKVLLLNNANRPKGIYRASTGGITGTMVDIRILFAVVLKSLSTAIVLAHNHPSGTCRPSEADRNLTEKIKRAAELFDVKVLDHVIILPDGNYYSFADNHIL